MANISGLSNEILFMILDFIEWDDHLNVLNFCHASSSLLLCTQAFRQKHLDLLRLFSIITNDGWDWATLLTQCLTQPRTALYPSLLKIRGLKPAWNDAENHYALHLKPPQADLDLFQRNFANELQMIAKDYIHFKHFLTCGEQGIVKGREDALVALLLLILPNLTEVQYDGYGSMIHACSQIIPSMSAQQRLKPRNHYLHKLHSVTIRLSVDNSCEKHELLEKFVQLPSVRRISCENIFTSESILDSGGPPSMKHGALDELSLEHCAFDSKSMFDLLSGIGGELKSFHSRP